MNRTIDGMPMPTPPSILHQRKRPSPDNGQGEKAPPMKKMQLSSSTPKPTVFASDIVDRLKSLFPEHDVTSIPCKTARLFACFTLLAEQSVGQGNNSEMEQQRESRRNRSTKHVKPILLLLSALVNAEKTSLGSKVPRGTVQFSGFDYSSTAPPVDSLFGSQQHREAEIGALSQALDQVNLVRNSVENRDEIITCLESMISFLRVMEKNEGKDLRVECSKSMPSQLDWPSQRFKKAAKTYRTDFEKLVTCLLPRESQASQASQCPQHLFLEQNLAESIGQAIRFYLRAFFNPVPWKKTPGTDQVAEQAVRQSRHQSRVSEMLVMKLPEGLAVQDTAIADGAISSVFSTALRVVYLYFGANVFLSDEDVAPHVPTDFCTSEASQRGPGKKRKPMSDEDVNQVVSDIHEAQCFRDAAVACRFLSNLMNFPGVREEIARVCGGWPCVEKHAQKIIGYELTECCPDDAYLVLLSDTTRFFQRIDSYKMVLEPLISPCETRLQEMSVKFKCGPKHKRARNNNPLLEPINSAMEDGFKMEDVAIVAI